MKKKGADPKKGLKPQACSAGRKRGGKGRKDARGVQDKPHRE